MNSTAQSEWVRNGPSDAEKMSMESSVGASKASHNEAVILDSNNVAVILNSNNVAVILDSNNVVGTGNLVSGMPNGDMAAVDSNSKLASTYSDFKCVIEDLPDGRNGKYAVSNKLEIHKKALPKLSCEKNPGDFIESNLPVINEMSPNHKTSPSSPMIMALRDAVSSLNRMEDFEIIENIGEGFYAKVYKVI